MKTFVFQDKYFHKAKEEGYRARSAYKLKDIQAKFKLIKKGDVVVDLGAAPGSFLQVIHELVGPKGRAFGIDLQRIQGFEDAPNVQTVVGDIMETDAMIEFFKARGFETIDVMTSDLAPKTSGIRDVDQGLSAELTDQALFLASKILKPGGHFIGKVFDGPDLYPIQKKAKRWFEKVTLFKPPSCRERSFETYLIALKRVPKSK